MEPKDGRHDFDFFIGKWKVKHRKLKALMQGSAEWDEFESTVEDRKILGGIGNFEEMTFQRESGAFYGVSISLFNPKTAEWSQYWVDSANAVLTSPMVGKFNNGVGQFFAEDDLDGKPVMARAIWSKVTANSCQWEQALSDDGGKTWETNWVMEFERV